jgi:hypothetical protein
LKLYALLQSRGQKRRRVRLDFAVVNLRRRPEGSCRASYEEAPRITAQAVLSELSPSSLHESGSGSDRGRSQGRAAWCRSVISARPSVGRMTDNITSPADRPQHRVRSVTDKATGDAVQKSRRPRAASFHSRFLVRLRCASAIVLRSSPKEQAPISAPCPPRHPEVGAIFYRQSWPFLASIVAGPRWQSIECTDISRCCA